MDQHVENIRKHLQEILGTDGKNFFSDDLIRRHLRHYQGRADAIQCALESLCEDYYEESNRFLNDHLPTFAFSSSQTQRGPVEFFQNPFKRKKPSSSSTGSMGCGSSYDYRGSGSEAAQSEGAASHCDLCGKTFSFISRKRSCADCANIFCSSCLPVKGGTCSRCGVLNKRPPHRGELMKLRVKDLQHFLTRKRINIKSCVEKKDLVELVVQHSGVTSPVEVSSWEEAGIRVSDQIPLERRGNFPQNYVESNHRREWFQEKFGTGTETCDEETPVQNITSEDQSTATNTPVEQIDASSEDEVMSVVVDDADLEDDEDKKDKSEGNKEPSEVTEPSQVETLSEEVELEAVVDGAVGGASGAEHDPEEKSTLPKQNFDHLSDNTYSTSLPGSPRRFANHGLVYLSEIETLDDLKELSTKQIKDLLAMNRVNFKGCVEKEELLKILQRLWKQEQRNKNNLENMEDDSLCKICMDSPIDCVMLECGHMCTCTNCGKQMAECPICRQYVVRVVKTFKA